MKSVTLFVRDGRDLVKVLGHLLQVQVIVDVLTDLERGKRVQRQAVTRAQRVARILPFGDCPNSEAVEGGGRQVLERVDDGVDAAVEQGIPKRAREHAGSTEARE